jgi:hypothetical protein
VIVPPLEIFPLLGSFDSPEFTIVPVLLAQVNTVRTIFLVIPLVIIVSVPIVVLLFVTVSLRRRRNQHGAREKRTQKQKPIHLLTSASLGHVASLSARRPAEV